MARWQLSPDTEAILLLCGVFGGPAVSARPLTLRDYNKLALWLADHGYRPADLVADTSANILGEIPSSVGDRQRFAELLGRGGILALAYESWSNQGIWVIGRADDCYPSRLKRRLGMKAPALLFGIGDESLLELGGLAIVGSLDADPIGIAFTQELGRRCAKQGIQVVSGGARGVDSASMTAALEEGGTAVGVLAADLQRAALSRTWRSHVRDGRLVLCSAVFPAARFQVGNAMGRNKYIYTLADHAVAVAATAGRGGTWAGATENLRNGWVPLLVHERVDGPRGNRELLAMNARPISARLLDGVSDLRSWLQEQGQAGTGSPSLPARQKQASMDLAREPSLQYGKPTAVDEPGTPVAHAMPPERFSELLRGRPAEALLLLFWGHMRRLGPEAKRERVIAGELGLGPGQVRTWMKMAMHRGWVEKQTKPVRYRVTHEGALVTTPQPADSLGEQVVCALRDEHLQALVSGQRVIPTLARELRLTSRQLKKWLAQSPEGAPEKETDDEEGQGSSTEHSPRQQSLNL